MSQWFKSTYLLPDSRFRIYWNYVILSAILYFAVKNPVFFSFNITTDGWVVIADTVCTLIFLCDILILFRSAFYKDGELVTDIEVIRRRYLRSWFVVDFIATLPFDLLALSFGYETLALYLSLLRLLKLKRVYRLFSKISLLLSYSLHVRFVLFAFWVILGVNLCACGWILITPNDASVDRVTFYIKAVYWVVTTLTTVGYGDICPQTNIARIYTMIMMLLGVGMYGFVIGNISTLLVSINLPRAASREKLTTLASYMKQYEIPFDLQESIFNFYTHSIDQHLSNSFSKILTELPEALSEELKDHVNIHLITQVPLFKNLSRDLIKEIVKCFVTQIFSPSEIIIQAGEEGNEIFFLVHGTVEVISPVGKSLNKLRTGSFFGELSLLRQARRGATVKALTYCQVYRLASEDLEKLMEKHPPLKKQIQAIAKKRIPGE